MRMGRWGAVPLLFGGGVGRSESAEEAECMCVHLVETVCCYKSECSSCLFVQRLNSTRENHSMAYCIMRNKTVVEYATTSTWAVNFKYKYLGKKTYNAGTNDESVTVLPDVLFQRKWWTGSMPSEQLGFTTCRWLFLGLPTLMWVHVYTSASTSPANNALVGYLIKYTSAHAYVSHVWLWN